MTAASVDVSRLTHRYPGTEVPALRDVSFSIAPGERIGLLGPNGAGKSTLMRLLCGYLAVQDWDVDVRVWVAGHDVRTDSIAVRQRVGYLPEQVPLYPELRVREHLRFRAEIKRVRWRDLHAEIARVADLTGLVGMMDVPIQRLSRGYRQRVGIADALLGAPPLVVLDEPTVGLDPNQVQSIRGMLRALGGAQTVLFSSHILAEVEALCDRIIILSKGSIVTDQPVAAATDARRLRVVLECDEATLDAVLAAAREAIGGELSPLQAPVRSGESIVVSVSGDESVARAIGRACAAKQVPVLRLEPQRTPLEEHFARVTGAAEGPT